MQNKDKCMPWDIKVKELKTKVLDWEMLKALHLRSGTR